MGHKGVRLLAVTGGSGVVRQAMTNAIREGCRTATLITTRTSADAEAIARQMFDRGLFDDLIADTDNST